MIKIFQKAFKIVYNKKLYLKTVSKINLRENKEIENKMYLQVVNISKLNIIFRKKKNIKIIAPINKKGALIFLLIKDSSLN